MYDFWLGGGKDHFAVDRTAALEVSEAAPEIKLMALENRKFLRRAVRYLAAEGGITQFLDIGTGLPTQGNVHQVAQQVNPDAGVVYVDNDPMVLAHSRALKSTGNTAVIQADLRDPAAILDHPRTLELIDFSQPLAVLLVAVLHFIGDDDDPPRDSRVDPRGHAGRKLPGRIARDERDPQRWLSREGGGALPQERGVRGDAAQPR
jgi:hypothetical protein